MDKKHKGGNQGNSNSRVPKMLVAQLIRLEEVGLKIQQGKAAPSNMAILVRATQHVLDTSRREHGFWNRTGIVTSESSNVKTAVIYVMADKELHLLTLGGKGIEVQELLECARKSGHLDVLWSTAMDSRLSRIAFDECLSQAVTRGANEGEADAITSVYDVMRAAHYALGDRVLQQVGIDPARVKRQFVHFLATPAMLQNADKWAGQLQ